VAHQPALAFQFHFNIHSIAPVGAHQTLGQMRSLLITIACLTISRLEAFDIPPEVVKAFADTRHADSEDAQFAARELLATFSSKYPEVFTTIILSEPDVEKRWMAVHAVRLAGNDKCDKALVTIFNNPKEPQELRIQVMFVLIQVSQLSKDRLRAFLPGLHLILRERPRSSDLENAIELVGYLGDGSSVPLLIPLLDDRKVHSYTGADDGKQTPKTISKTAHEALQSITGKRDIPADRSSWEAIK